MRMQTAILLLTLLFVPLYERAQQQLPILDMHMHAMPADAQGPPPLPMCTPAPFFPAWDPAIPYLAMLTNIYKDLPCDDPIWSPRTDQEVMRETITAMARLGIVGVLSGSPERVAAWREAGASSRHSFSTPRRPPPSHPTPYAVSSRAVPWRCSARSQASMQAWPRTTSG
jgi:uncharacterized protein